MNASVRRQSSRILRLLAAAAALASTCAPAGTADLTRMRAVHFTGNWGTNIEGIRTSVSGPLSAAPAISAASVVATVTRGDFTDSNGATFVNELAQVRMSGVTIGAASFPQAGFWVGREAIHGTAFIQFRPSLDPSLAGIPGFAGDITLGMAGDASSIDLTSLRLATGPAHDYVIAVLAHGADLVHQASFDVLPTATFDRPSVERLLRAVTTTLLAQETQYWDFLKAQNVEWIGISVAMFSAPLSDPTVRLRYRAAGATDRNAYTFDDADLAGFIAKAKRLGFKVYLTLAFEDPGKPSFPPDTADPTCNTTQFIANRAFFGEPKLVTGDPNQACLNATNWWWDPAHPLHAQNVAQFWSSYTQVAVKYATMAQQLGVDLYSLGTETGRLFRARPSQTWNDHFGPQLGAMVAAVRGVYSGLLTYDQEASVTQHPEWFDGGAGSTLFADLGLDVIGVSAYFSLVEAPVTRVMSVAELQTAWGRIYDSLLVPLKARNGGKPIVFTEFGYTDDVNAPASPGSNAQRTLGPDIANGKLQQQHILQAFFDVDDAHDNLVKGAFLWGNGTSASTDCTWVDYSILCKPSADTIAAIYGRWKHLFQGLWFNAAESGWGMSVMQHGAIAFNTLFTYDTSGRPVWFVMSSCAVSGNGCSGAVYRVTGGTTPTQAWSSAALAVSPAGTATLAFAPDANSGTLRFTIDGVSGSRSISREVFGAGAAPTVDHTDLWWNSGESGWGVALTQQSGTIFATWYAYGPSGEPAWYVASNCAVTAAGCAGDLFRVNGGSPISLPWNAAPLVVTKVGTVTFTFVDADNGSMAYTIDGASASRAISRQPF